LRKDFVSNEEEPSIFRVDAALSLGLLEWDAGDREATADYYCMGMDVAAETSDLERSRAMEFSKLDSMYTRTVGEKMDELTKIIEKNLRKLERPRMGDHPKKLETRSDGSEIWSRQDSVPLYSDYSITERLMKIGGTHCDCCGKSRQELGLAT
jgi:hypothetical protein